MCASCPKEEESTNQTEVFICRRLCVCTLSHGVGVFVCVWGGQVEAKLFLKISLAGNPPSALSVCLPPFWFYLDFIDTHTLHAPHTHTMPKGRCHASLPVFCSFPCSLPSFINSVKLINPLSYLWCSLTLRHSLRKADVNTVLKATKWASMVSIQAMYRNILPPRFVNMLT